MRLSNRLSKLESRKNGRTVFPMIYLSGTDSEKQSQKDAYYQQYPEAKDCGQVLFIDYGFGNFRGFDI